MLKATLGRQHKDSRKARISETEFAVRSRTKWYKCHHVYLPDFHAELSLPSPNTYAAVAPDYCFKHDVMPWQSAETMISNL